MVIPWPASDQRYFLERLTNYQKEYRTINGIRFLFIIEETRADSFHACTVNDVSEMLRHVNPSDYGDLKLIVFRQPKRKEQILSGVWGRLIYSYSFEDEDRPAIIIEAQPLSLKLKWPKSLNPDGLQELARLRMDGHHIVDEKSKFIIHSTKDSIRNTQLYRTLPHEIGHYKHYLEVVGNSKNLSEEEFERREDVYFNIPKQEQEKFAHHYADFLSKTLISSNAIPFERL